MGRDRSTPALFEVIRDGARPRPWSGLGRSAEEAPPPAIESQVEPVISPPAPGSAMGPGRALRVPVGHIFVAAAAVLLLMVLSYFVGHKQGKATLMEGAEAGLGMIDGRPVVREPGPGNASESGGSIGDGTETASLGPKTVNRPDNTPTRRYALNEDTRVKGLNYLIVDAFGAEEANRVAEFLVSNGIDVMVLPVNNLRQVIVRQGFEGWASNLEGQALKERIIRLGREWKNQHGGKKAFNPLAQKQR